MKPTRTLLIGMIGFCASQSFAQAGNTWDGGVTDNNNWGTNENWDGDTAPVYGTLTFAGAIKLTNNNNSINSMNQVQWQGAGNWVMEGSTTLALFDFNHGTSENPNREQAKLQSMGAGGVTIKAPITFAATEGPNFGEINAIDGNVVFESGTLAVNGSALNGIKFWGGIGKDVKFRNTVSAGGKWFATTGTGTSITIATGANVSLEYMNVMNDGILNVGGGSLSASAVRLGGDYGATGNADLTKGGTLALTATAGGLSFANTINTVTSNTSNSLLIDSKNSSGTNTISGSVYLDSALRIQTASGGTLAFTTGTFDIKQQGLTVDGAGTTTIAQALQSTIGAGGFLVKSGSGTLILSSTSNNYTGTDNNALNKNGTQIAGGILGIHGDGSLGIVPANSYDNIQFTSSGTLQDTANEISLDRKRNVNISSGATATFDSNGHTFTINGVINGSGGNVAVSGGGKVVLAGTNTYTGTTSVGSGGTLLINGSTSTSSAVTANSGATLGGYGTVGGATTIFGTHNVSDSDAGDRTQNFSSSLTYVSGSIFAWDLAAGPGDPGAGTSNAGLYDKVAASGAVTGNSKFEILLGGNSFSDPFWNTNKSWIDIFSKESGSATLQTIFTSFGGSGVDTNGAVANRGQFSFTGDTLQWSAVPEVSNLLAGILLGAGLLRRRRSDGALAR